MSVTVTPPALSMFDGNNATARRLSDQACGWNVPGPSDRISTTKDTKGTEKSLS
jgi:hypothetical protein